MKKPVISILLVFLVIVCAGLLVPEKLVIPVEGASSNDWNHNTFWYEPWGSSGVHKGIDIFGAKGTPVQSATAGYVIYTGELGKGGNVVGSWPQMARTLLRSFARSYCRGGGLVISKR